MHVLSHVQRHKQYGDSPLPQDKSHLSCLALIGACSWPGPLHCALPVLHSCRLYRMPELSSGASVVQQYRLALLQNRWFGCCRLSWSGWQHSPRCTGSAQEPRPRLSTSLQRASAKLAVLASLQMLATRLGPLTMAAPTPYGMQVGHSFLYTCKHNCIHETFCLLHDPNSCRHSCHQQTLYLLQQPSSCSHCDSIMHKWYAQAMCTTAVN